MPPAARITDMHTCPMVNPGPVPHVGGPIIKGNFTVLTVNLPQARISDQCICVGPPDMIAKGSTTVLCGGLPAARMGDSTAHGGVIVMGAPTVLIGNGSNGGGGGGGGGAGMPGNVAFSEPNLQSKTMIAAHKEAKPFCAICEGEGEAAAKQNAAAKAAGGNPGSSGAAQQQTNAASMSSKTSDAFADDVHAGMHNDSDLRVEYKDYDWDNFETSRKIDMDNLSESDEEVMETMLAQGRSRAEIKEVLSSSSGNGHQIKTVEKGDKFYGFQDSSAPAKDGNNKYWLDEDGFKDVERKFFKDGAWDKQGVKSHLALPCSNAANSITIGTASRTDVALQTNIGEAVEIVPYKNSKNVMEEVLLELPGGGKQITPPIGLIKVP